MKTVTFIMFFLAIAFATDVRAGRVVTDSLYSSLLKVNLTCSVILPDSYDQQIANGTRFPVLYLLHCAGCSYTNWTDGADGNVDSYIDSIRFIVVCPEDGSASYKKPYRSWWLNSPVLPDYQYSSFLVSEFKPHIDSLYATLPGRTSTGCAGFSMGGFGALHNIIEHPEVFGVAFGIKGGMDIIPFPSNWDLPMVLGYQSSALDNWHSVNIIENICSLSDRQVSIGFYTGLYDFFKAGNDSLHALMTACSMSHTFWMTEESHGGIPDSSMRRVLRWFDTTFLYTTAVRRITPLDNSFQVKPVRFGSGDGVVYNLKGQRAYSGDFRQRKEKLSGGVYFLVDPLKNRVLLKKLIFSNHSQGLSRFFWDARGVWRPLEVPVGGSPPCGSIAVHGWFPGAPPPSPVIPFSSPE